MPGDLLRRIISILLLATAALFVLGVVIERRDENHLESTELSATGAHDESVEGRQEPESEAAQSSAHEEQVTRVLGINAESTPLVVLAVAASVLLAILTWRSDSRLILTVVGLIAAGFTVFDLAEVVHQLDESRGGLAFTAALIAAGHASIAALATISATRTRRDANLTDAA
jgi:Flp pilus assembly protein TadB